MANELIAKLEAATGPDRALDGEIFKACYPNRDWLEFADGWCARDPDDGCAFDVAPKYSASIDAALTLVPEGWGGSIHFSEDRPDCELHCTVSLGRSYPTNANAYAGKSGKDATRASVALAICIAALRAKDSQ